MSKSKSKSRSPRNRARSRSMSKDTNGFSHHEKKSRGGNFLVPFLLGAAAATSLIFFLAFAGAQSTCRGAARDLDKIFDPALSARGSSAGLVQTEPVPNGLFARWRHKRKLKREEEAKRASEGRTDEFQCMAPMLQNPTVPACQLYWSGLERVGLVYFVPDAARTLLARMAEQPLEKADENNNDDQSAEVPESTGLEVTKQPTLTKANIDSEGDQDASALEEKFAKAVTLTHLPISASQRELIQKLDSVVRQKVAYWETRATKVPWGGTAHGHSAWYKKAVKRALPTSTDLETLNGGPLYFSYLRIMKWPSNLYAYVMPFKTCGKKGCDSYVALQHSLQFREVYKPWLVSKSAIEENKDGCIYHHGFTPSFGDEPTSGHSLVWLRPGQCKPKDYLATIRAYVYTLERSIEASLKHSGGRVGKMNVVVDGSNFSFSAIPPLKAIKTIVTMLQDHFPDRLGMVLITNMGTAGDMLLKLLLPLLTQEVRDKIQVLPNQKEDRQGTLEILIGKENIPTWLGGSDTFKFDAGKYYDKRSICDEKTARAYLEEMPYHS